MNSVFLYLPMNKALFYSYIRRGWKHQNSYWQDSWGQGFDILVVDDSSPDGTADVVLELVKITQVACFGATRW